ncbi:MAG: AAA family ATPase [Bacteroidales bacterium]|nr:AAA family ATPase [Bacteroidales bacterium]
MQLEELKSQGLKLDETNEEFKYALEYALYTNNNIYLTGRAGTGKTTFLHYLQQVSNKKIAVLAPTGIAAIKVGGQTIHSFFQIPPSVYVPNDRRLRSKAPANDKDRSTLYDHFKYTKERQQLINNIDMIVIDEVSMVRCDLLDVVDSLLRTLRRNQYPFGGVQMLFVGDVFQLPPVVPNEDSAILKQFYDSEFFFSAHVMRHVLPTLCYIELKKIYRQNELNFINLLNRVRENKALQEDYNTLHSKLIHGFNPSTDDNYITLVTTNKKALDINNNKLNSLSTTPRKYTAEIEGTFPTEIHPTEKVLDLKVEAQVMFIRNNRKLGIYNGMIGTISEMKANEITVTVSDDNGKKRDITTPREIWENKRYEWDEEEKQVVETVIGTFLQFPLRLAWAITVHKSQGLTFNKVVADIGSSFTSGQVYVALSRCTSLDGLVLTSPITPKAIITNYNVLNFAQNESSKMELQENLNPSKADFYYKKSRNAFQQMNAEQCIDHLYTAIGYRNDIATPQFRKFILIYLKYIFRLLKKCEVKENSELEDKITTLESKIHKLETSLKEKDSLLSNSKKTINELTAEINTLTEKVETFQTINKEAYKELLQEKQKFENFKSNTSETIGENEKLKKELNEYKSQINLLNQKNKKLAKENNKHIQTIESLNKEIERVKNISWIQKLFGKK